MEIRRFSNPDGERKQAGVNKMKRNDLIETFHKTTASDFPAQKATLFQKKAMSRMIPGMRQRRDS